MDLNNTPVGGIQCPLGDKFPSSCAAGGPDERFVGELVPSAGFATRPPPGHPDRRLWLLEALRPDSAVSRVGHCRRTPIGAGGAGREADPVYRRKAGDDGKALVYVSGLQTCGRITCPVCGVRIRRAERERMRHLNAAHLAAGGALCMSILSLSHGPLDDPADVLDALYAGRRRAVGSDAGGAWAKDRERFGVVGVAWHLDPPPIGKNGMHWHLNLTWYLERELTPDELAELQARVHGRYTRELERRGRWAHASLNEIQPVRCPEKAADYVAKPDGAHGPTGPADVAATMAGEATRGDVKRSKGRLPLDVLAEWGETGDYAALELFQAYERALDGRTWRYKPAALLARYGDGEAVEQGAEEPAEGSPEAEAAALLDDADDASDDVGGSVVLRPGRDGWRAIQATWGADRRVRGLLRSGEDERARSYVAGLAAAIAIADSG